MRPLNLSSRPFRNELIPGVLFGLACVALLAATVQHVLVLRRLLSQSTTALQQEVIDLEGELGRLAEEARRARLTKPDASQVARWTFIKDLVDRRTFSWTELLARLEDVLPDGARLQAIQPELREGSVKLGVDAMVRSSEDGLAFVTALEARPEFADVYPLGVQERDGEAEFKYSMRYVPGPPAAAAEPVPEDDAPEDAGEPGDGSFEDLGDAEEPADEELEESGDETPPEEAGS